MKKAILTIAVVLTAMVSVSCDDICDNCNKDGIETIIEASMIETANHQTKTSISEKVNGAVKYTWLAGDAINVFFGASESSIFVTNTTARVAQFKGTIGAVTGGGDDLTSDTSLWGVYPYNQKTTCDGASITMTLPHEQESKADDLADDLFPSIARSTNFQMAFYPVCGSISFKVASSDIVRVTLSGNNNEKLAGKAKVSMELGGKPNVEEVTDGQTVLSITAPNGGCFEPGKSYYFVFYPSDFEKGLTLTYYKKDSYASFSYPNPYPIGRNEFGSISAKDGNLTFAKTEVLYIDEYGVNRGSGVDIDGVVWAPVNCGYHETDYPYGKLYQWGRKYGQGYSGQCHINENEVVNVSDASVPIIGGGNISIIEGNLIKNQQIHYSDDDDWAYPTNDQAWNAGTQEFPIKTVYDPCPNGWRIPTYNELATLAGNHSSWVTHESKRGIWFSGSHTYKEDISQVFFPAAGYRDNYGHAMNRGRRGAYWCSQPNDYKAYELYLASVSAYMDGSDNKAYGCSVRCVYDINAYNVEGKDPEEVTGYPASTLAFASTSIKILEGDVINMAGLLLPRDATYYNIAWGSNTPDVATVDKDGMVSGIKSGEAIITATVAGLTATCLVMVSEPLCYVDEYGVDQGVGIAVGRNIWAPVNCGYHETDYPWGKLYQWGRKYGQGYSEEYDNAPEIVEGPVSLEEGQNPDNAQKFYTTTSEPHCWTTTQDYKLWNSGTEDEPKKSSYDPCPEGWRIPTHKELKALSATNYSSWMTLESQNGRWFSGPFTYQDSAPQVFFPAAGSRLSEGYLRNYCGLYWCSDNPYYLCFDSTNRTSFSWNDMSHGNSVRCVQE